MARPKKQRSQKSASPIQFRPRSELAQMITAFGAQHGLTLPEGCRALVGLAVTGMDTRFYALMRDMAETVGEENALLRVCVHIHTALEGGQRAGNRSIQFDPERTLFIVATARAFLKNRGLKVKDQSLAFLSEHMRLVVKRWDEAEQEAPEWSSTEQAQEEPVRVRS